MTHTLISCKEAQILNRGKPPTVFKEFSKHSLHLVLSEDGTAIVRKLTTLLICVVM